MGVGCLGFRWRGCPGGLSVLAFVVGAGCLVGGLVFRRRGLFGVAWVWAVRVSVGVSGMEFRRCGLFQVQLCGLRNFMFNYFLNPF